MNLQFLCGLLDISYDYSGVLHYAWFCPSTDIYLVSEVTKKGQGGL